MSWGMMMFANLEGKTIAIGALLVGIAAALLFHFYEVSSLHRQIDKLTTANAKLGELNAAYKSANETCAALTQQQNAQIDALKAASDAREAAAAAALAAAREDAARKYASAKTILTRAPRNPAGACASLNDLFDEALGGK